MNLHASSNSALSKTIGSDNILQTPFEILDAPRGSLSAVFLLLYVSSIGKTGESIASPLSYSLVNRLVFVCAIIFSSSTVISSTSRSVILFIFLDSNTTIAPFPLDPLLPTNKTNYFRYSGSLTTPTCNEAVTWTVFNESVEISQAQVKFHF